MISIKKEIHINSIVDNNTRIEHPTEKFLLPIPEEEIIILQKIFQETKSSIEVWRALKSWISNTIQQNNFLIVNTPKIIKDIIDYKVFEIFEVKELTELDIDISTLSYDAFMY